MARNPGPRNDIVRMVHKLPHHLTVDAVGWSRRRPSWSSSRPADDSRHRVGAARLCAVPERRAGTLTIGDGPDGPLRDDDPHHSPRLAFGAARPRGYQS